MDIVDFHAHVIPGADHGSSSIEISIAQLESAKKYGVNRIIATPHFYPHRENVDRFIDRRNKCFEHLKRHLSDNHPQIILGAEVLICDNIEEIPLLDALCIDGSKTLLLELPFTDFFDGYVDSVRYLINRGYTVVLAHAERYDPHNIDKLISVGAYVQLNANSLCRFIINKHIKRWLAEKRVFALGSDIHGPDTKAYYRFIKAIKRAKSYINTIKVYSDSILDKH